MGKYYTGHCISESYLTGQRTDTLMKFNDSKQTLPFHVCLFKFYKAALSQVL